MTASIVAGEKPHLFSVPVSHPPHVYVSMDTKNIPCDINKCNEPLNMVNGIP